MTGSVEAIAYLQNARLASCHWLTRARVVTGTDSIVRISNETSVSAGASFTGRTVTVTAAGADQAPAVSWAR